MSDEQDKRIAELYRQSSQETPPARVDHAVMDRARQSLRHSRFSPFGNQWVVGGATLAVVVLSAMLVLTMPEQPVDEAIEQDAAADSQETLSGEQLQPAPAAVPTPPARPRKLEKKRAAPAPSEPVFDFYNRLPESEVTAPSGEMVEGLQPRTAPLDDQPAGRAIGSPAATWYLQVGAFRDLALAEALQARLVKLGFECQIHTAGVGTTDIFYRVRVGPFEDPAVLEKSRKALEERGLEPRPIRYHE